MKNSFRLVPAVLLIAAGVASYALTPNDHASVVSALDAVDSESTSLYCAAGGSHAAASSIRLWNSASVSRHVSATLSSTKGSNHAEWDIKAHHSIWFRPSDLVGGDDTTARITSDGGGVVGAQASTSAAGSGIGCQSRGVTSWYAAGLDTQQGATVHAVLLNPTATPTVVNVSTWSSLGFLQPAAYTGLVIPALSQVTLSLDHVLVNASHLSVAVTALRGNFVAAVTSQLGANISLIAGTTSPQLRQLYPTVPTDTVQNDTLEVFNPGETSARVTVKVRIPGFSVTPFELVVGPSSFGSQVIVPNTRIPAASVAVIDVSSTAPIVTTMRLNRSGAVTVMSPPPLVNEVAYIQNDAKPDAVRVATSSPTTVTFVWREGSLERTAQIKSQPSGVPAPAAWLAAGRGTVSADIPIAVQSVRKVTSYEAALDPRQ